MVQFIFKGERMKRFLTLSVIVLLVMLPLVSFAKTVINDKDLEEVTAEAGVSIEFTNLKMGNNATTMSSISWGDTTGFTGFTTPGYFGFKNIIISGDLVQIGQTGVTGLSNVMTIDVGTAGAETKIGIKLPTITMGTTNVVVWVMADRTANFTSASQSQGGLITMEGYKTTITGTVALYAH